MLRACCPRVRSSVVWLQKWSNPQIPGCHWHLQGPPLHSMYSQRDLPSFPPSTAAQPRAEPEHGTADNEHASGCGLCAHLCATLRKLQSASQRSPHGAHGSRAAFGRAAPSPSARGTPGRFPRAHPAKEPRLSSPLPLGESHPPVAAEGPGRSRQTVR